VQTENRSLLTKLGQHDGVCPALFRITGVAVDTVQAFSRTARVRRGHLPTLPSPRSRSEKGLRRGASLLCHLYVLVMDAVALRPQARRRPLIAGSMNALAEATAGPALCQKC
jgi:hypothetical protein